MENMPVSMPVTYHDAVCGAARLSQDGLYTCFQCECRPVSEAVLRAYARVGDGQICLGVLVPEQGQLRLRRKLPTSQLSELHAVYLATEESVWSPWKGQIADCELVGMTRREHGRQVVAVPYDPVESLPYLRLFERLEPLWLDGKLHLRLPEQ